MPHIKTLHPYIRLALWIIVYIGVSFSIGQLSQGSIDSWYQSLQKPFLSPPNWVFPVVWTILYVMIATAGWKIWEVKASKEIKILFVLYTFMNWAWTPIFFGLHMILGGFVWIMLLNIVAFLFILKVWNKSLLAALLMVPSLIWTLFAAFLNFSIYVLNNG